MVLSAEYCTKMVALVEDGRSQRYVVVLLVNVSHSTIQRVLHRFGNSSVKFITLIPAEFLPYFKYELNFTNHSQNYSGNGLAHHSLEVKNFYSFVVERAVKEQVGSRLNMLYVNR